MSLFMVLAIALIIMSAIASVGPSSVYQQMKQLLKRVPVFELICVMAVAASLVIIKAIADGVRVTGAL